MWQYPSGESERRGEREGEGEREKERDKGDFDSSNSPGQYVIANVVSVVQLYIQLQGSNNILLQHISLIIGKTNELWP